MACFLCGNSHSSDKKNRYRNGTDIVELCQDKERCSSTLLTKRATAAALRAGKPLPDASEPDRRTLSSGD